MICKNCSTEYDDSYSFCPKCGAENAEKIKLGVPEYTAPMEFTDISSFSDSASYEERPEAYVSAQTQQVEAADDGYGESFIGYSYNGEEEQLSDEVEESVQEEPVQEEEPACEAEAQTESEQELETESEAQSECPEYVNEAAETSAEENAQSVQADAETAPQIKRRRRPVSSFNRKEENKRLTVIIIIMCVVAVLAAALSALKISTDTLEVTEPVEKVVASVGLSTQEELMLEEVVARCFAVLRTDFNSELTDAESFLSKINPYDKGGVYSLVYNEYPEVQTEADPACRFYDEENEAYAYYKLEEKKIDDLMSMFGISAHHEINSQNCYYYDGYYYFAYVVQKTTVSVKAEITKSKRVLDGSYYSECYFYAESGEKRVETDTYYLLTEKTGDLQSGTVSFNIKRISTAPIFDESGKLVEARTYKIKKQVIEGKTADGKVYCRYTFEYPVFSEDNIGYQAINTFFTDAINAYRLRADSAQKSYEDYIEQGGKAEELPLTETAIARVSYENEKYISIVEKIGVNDPTPVQNAVPVTAEEDDEDSYEQDGETVNEGVTLFKRTVDGYVFDKTTGQFVSKDVLVGKDYMVVSEILYRIYNGYEYESIIPEPQTEEVTDEYGEVVEDEEYYEDEEDYYYYDDEIPDDEDGFGTVIYESTCAFTQNGLTFFYVNADGIVEEVTIPHAVVERLAQS